MRKASLLLLLAFTVAGCGGSTGSTQTVTVTTNGSSSASGGSSSQPETTTTGSPLTALKLVSAGFTEYVSAGNRQIDFYALIKNPNLTRTFDQSEVDVDFLSKSGAVVDSELEYANYILPGQSFPVVDSVFNPPATHIAKMQVRIGAPYNWISASSSKLLATKLIALHTSNNYGLYEAKGVAVIKSTFTDPIKQAPVVFLYYNGHHQFVGFDRETANFIPAQGKAEQSFDDFPHTTIHHVVPYAGLDNGSSVGNQSLF